MMNKKPVALDVFLDKIKHLYGNMNEGAVSQQLLELALLKRYTAEWYEAILVWEAQLQHGGKAAEPVASSPSSPAVYTAHSAPPEPALQSSDSSHDRAIAAASSAQYDAQPSMGPGTSARVSSAPFIQASGDSPVLSSELSGRHTPVSGSRTQQTSHTTPGAAAFMPSNPAATPPSEPALNDRFARSEKELGQTIQARPAEDLRRLIDVNERFLFIKELFDGNSDLYNQAIRKLGEIEELDQSLNYLDQDLGPKLGWSGESKVVAHLRDIVEQRFKSASA